MRIILAAATLGLLFLADVAYPQARPNSAAPSVGPGTAQQQAKAAEAKAWTLFYAGKYEAAAIAVQPLLKSDRHDVQVEAEHLFARCLWSANTGSGGSRRAAQKLWKQLDTPLAESTTTIRLAIAKALALDDQKKTTDAIDLLNHQHILEGRGGSGGTAQAEAAIELAQLYREGGNLDEAGKLLDAIPTFFAPENLPRLEVDPAEIQPFLTAAASAKALLKYDAQPGLADFEQAEQLRAAGKFPQAIAIYQKIIKTYPTTDFAPHSDLCIGYCQLGMKDAPKAIDHWKTFTAAAPAGPWRGQAFVALIDIALEQKLDLDEAAKQAELAANAISTALDDKKSGPQGGWKVAAFDLYLRIGVVEFIQGRDSAADAFTQAATSDSPGTTEQTKASLTALADAAKTGKPILPAGLTTPSPGTPGEGRGEGRVGAAAVPDQPALALKIGVIYNVAGRFDHAITFFDRVRGAGTAGVRGVTPAELAFADFGKAAALQGQGNVAAAKDEYLASIKSDPSGAKRGWQDESCYRIARIIETQADAQYPAPPTPADDAPAVKPKPMTTADLEQKTAAERDRQAKLLSAKKSALPYWDGLLKQFPASPRIASAEYHAGILLWQLQQWPDAAAVFNKLVSAYPKDPLTGDAYVRIIDIDLEDTFSLNDAETASAAAVKWASWNMDAAQPEPDSAPVEPWRVTAYRDPQPDVKASAYAIYLRAGLAAYMDQKMGAAAELLRKGNQFDTSHQQQLGEETGLSRLIEIAQGGLPPLTPPELLGLVKDDKQKTGLVLADLYLEIYDQDKARSLYQRLDGADAPFPKPSAGIQAYLYLRLAQVDEFQQRDDRAVACLMRLYDPRFAPYPWTGEGIYRLGTWTYNHTQDPAQAMVHWKYVFTNMPKHPEAEASLFFYAHMAAKMQDYPKAVSAYNEYLKRYPNGEWVKLITETELPSAVEHANATNHDNKETKK